MNKQVAAEATTSPKFKDMMNDPERKQLFTSSMLYYLNNREPLTFEGVHYTSKQPTLMEKVKQ